MELLNEYGGAMFGADAMALRPVDELFDDPVHTAFACYENEQMRGDLLTPILAAAPNNPILQAMIDRIFFTEDVASGEPWKVTGNQLVTDMYRDHAWTTLKVFPSHYFIPNHYTGVEYRGEDKPYADHQWGSTTNSYVDVTKKL
jgi:mannosyltransferase OCH1-like enzyme